VPLVALSATAAPRVRADIIRLLQLRRPLIQVRSARRGNLTYTMRRRPQDPLPLVLEAIAASRGAVLLYARTRRSVEAWAARLGGAGIEAIIYHAGLDPESRVLALEHFQRAERPVLVATVAFGMGVDRPDVGLVLHLDLPASPEGYLQESGRAGRDGLPAQCLVLFDPADRLTLGWAMRASERQLPAEVREQERQRLALAQQQLRRMEAVAEGGGCREQALLLAVGELVPACGRCDGCAGSAQPLDWSEQAAQVLAALERRDGVDLRRLADELATLHGSDEERWGWLVRRLVQEELISESDDGSQRLWLRGAGRHYLRRPWPLRWCA
jgi:ATP-dependent DNA helicase RecQ